MYSIRRGVKKNYLKIEEWCGLYFSFLKPQTTFSSGNGSFKHVTYMHWQTSCAFIWVVCIRLGKEVCITCIYAGVGIHYYMHGIFIWIHLLSNDSWLVHDNIKQISVIYLCFIVDCCTSSLFISPEPKAQVNIWSKFMCCPSSSSLLLSL